MIQAVSVTLYIDLGTQERSFYTKTGNNVINMHNI